MILRRWFWRAGVFSIGDLRLMFMLRWRFCCARDVALVIFLRWQLSSGDFSIGDWLLRSALFVGGAKALGCPKESYLFDQAMYYKLRLKNCNLIKAYFVRPACILSFSEGRCREG